jgi:F420-dependent oxidoreductase-like protein
MHLGLHLVDFETHGKSIRAELKDIAQYADANGVYSLSVMDHFFQIGLVGPAEMNMLESYTTLGYLAGITEHIKLLAMVTGVVYRYPGILAKAVTTLDVLSEGRSYLGIGAAWNEREAVGLGVPFPAIGTRFEMLEETLQIMHQMWSGEVKPYNGKHFQLTETLNSPQPITRPRPPILIGGSGEKKTLRFVAQYGDACNLFLMAGVDTLKQKLEILKRHCDDVGRDFKEIELTLTGRVQPGVQSTSEIVAQFKEVADLGFSHVMLIVPELHTMTPLEILAREVIPAIEGF